MIVGALRAAVGLFCTGVGALMLILPHQYQSATYATISSHLAAWGTLFLLIGPIMLAVGMAPSRRALTIAAHLTTGVVLLVFASGFAATGGWTGAVCYGVIGLATALAAFPQRVPRWVAARTPDLLVVAMAVVAVLDGVAFLLLPDLFNRQFATIRQALPWFGLALLTSGLATMWAQLRPDAAWLARHLAHVALGGTLLAFMASSSLRSLNWTGIVFYGIFGTLVIVKPWATACLARVDLASLRTRLALSLAAATAIPLVAAVAVGTGSQERAAIEQGRATYWTLAASIAHDASGYIGLHRQALAGLAAQPGFSDLRPEEHQVATRALQAAFPDLLSVNSFDAEGSPIARSDGRPLVFAGGQRVFQDGRRTNRPSLEILMSPVYFHPVLAFGQPVRDADGAFAGFIIAELPSTSMADEIMQVGIGAGARVYLVDGSGRAIAHPDASLAESFADLASSPPVAELLRSNASSGSLSYKTGASDYLAGYARVPGLNWGIVVDRPHSTALAVEFAERERVFGMIVLAIAIAAGAGAFAASRLVAPMANLSNAVARLADGDVAVPLPHSRITEVMRLSGALGAMRDRLASRTAERDEASLALLNLNSGLEARVRHRTTELNERTRRLEALQDVTREISRELDLTKLLGLIVERASLLAQAGSGAVYLWDADARLLSPKAWWGAIDPEALLDVQLGQGATGTAAQRRVGVLTNDYASAPFGIPSLRRAGRVQSALSEPILYRGELIGSMTVSRIAGADPFTEQDSALLAIFSSQAAVAIENARLYAAEASARADAERATIAKGQFLATMSHEIRTPLNGVIGLSELLLTQELPAKSREYAEMIGRSGEALLGIINDILDLSKFEAGKLELEARSFDARTVVGDAAGLLAIQARRKGLYLEHEIAPDVPDSLIGDPSRLRQILFNLVGNAVKFTEAGGVAVRVAREADDARGAVLRFDVIDTGIGIDAAVQPRLFEPFVQADGSTARTHGGTGLGLAICKRLVEHMGGRLGVRSEPGRGSTFSFTASFGLAVEHATPLDHAKDEALVSAARPPVGAAPILVADDSGMNRIVVLAQLETLGYRADVVASGREAIEALAVKSYAAVLMDCHMPGMDGFVATAHVRRGEPDGQRVPIIAMTADVLPETRTACATAGMDDFLAKPLRIEELGAMLRRWLPLEDPTLALARS